MLVGGFRRPKHQPTREFSGPLAASHLSGSRQDVRGGKLDIQREQVGKAKKAGKRAEISLNGSRGPAGRFPGTVNGLNGPWSGARTSQP